MGIFGSVLVVSFIRFCFGSVLVLTGPLILLAYNFEIKLCTKIYVWCLAILQTSRESPSSIDNVMTIVRALPGVDSKFVVKASVVLLKRSRREMFLTFKEPESQLEWLQEMICWNQKK